MKSDFTIKIKPLVSFLQTLFFLLKDKTNALVVLLLSFVFYLSKEVSPLTYRFILHWFTVITGGKFRPCSVQLNLYFSTKKKYSNCIPINSWTKREKSDYVIDCSCVGKMKFVYMRSRCYKSTARRFLSVVSEWIKHPLYNVTLNLYMTNTSTSYLVNMNMYTRSAWNNSS